MEIGNAGDASARMISTTVLPKGALLSTYADITVEPYRDIVQGYRLLYILVPPPRPTTLKHVSVDVERPADVFELVHLLVEFAPSTWTPRHMHGGQELALVAMGAVTLERHGDTELFALGESWVNTPGLIHTAGNQSEDVAQVAATFLLPSGAILTTVKPDEAPAAADPSAT
jgi:quercetin dioxygenase-like cupin family protein